MTRDVWHIDRAGSLRRLTRRGETLQPPGPGEVCVRIEAIGLNFADIFACLGLYSATPRGPFIPGLEFAGVIEAAGPSVGEREGAVRSPEPGDRVFGVTRFGAYATMLNVSAGLVAELPQGWSFSQAAAFPVNALTALYGLVELARAARGELVLVHSAAGGVGLSALAILRSLGARIVATVGTPEKQQFLSDERGLPSDRIIVRDRRRFSDQLDDVLRAERSNGFDVVFDAVAGPFFMPALKRMRPGGRMVVYGAADFMPAGWRATDPRLLFRYVRRPRIDPLSLIHRNRSVMGFNLIWLWDQAHRLEQAYATLRDLCPEPPLVGRRFPFADALEALRFLQSGRSVGKVVLETTP